MNPIIFISWVLLLLYDTGVVLSIIQPGSDLLNTSASVMFVLMAVPAFKACELLPMLV